MNKIEQLSQKWSTVQKEYGNIKKTSEEWKNIPEFKSLVIMDPDGWNRQDMKTSWFKEKISCEEFINRVLMSTIQIPTV